MLTTCKQTKVCFSTLFVLLTFLIFTLVASCAVNTTGFSTIKSPDNDGYGELVVTMPESRGWSVQEYTVTATKSGETPVVASTPDSSVQMTLKLGTWTITVEGDDEVGNLIFQGIAQANVTESGTSVTVGLLKRAGNLKLQVNQLPGYNVADGDPGSIEKIVFTASKSGFPDVISEINNFASSVYMNGLAQGDWSVSIEGKAADLNPVDYSATGTFSTYVSGSYSENVIASNLVTVTETLTTQNIVTPVAFSYSSGTYSSAIDVALSCDTSGATILYSTDGSAPIVGYSGPITIGAGQTVTIKARASKAGVVSDSITGERTYTINPGITSTPQLSPTGGTYQADTTVTISCPDPGAVIYYTTDGSTPTTSLTAQSNPVDVEVNGDYSSVTIKAIAKDGAKDPSGVAQASYTIAYPQVVAPTISPTGGTFSTDQLFTLNSGTPGAIIYYTTDGSTPTTGSIQYTAPFTLAEGSYTLKTMATAPSYRDSTVSSGIFEITSEAPSSIVFQQVEVIIEGEDFNTFDITSGVTWLGIDTATTGSYILEWSAGFEGLVQLYQNDMETEVSLSGSGSTSQASLAAGSRYFVKVNSTYSAPAYQIRIYPGSIGVDPALSLDITSISAGSLSTGSTVQETFSVSNSGDGSLDWQAADDQSWISLTPTSGSVSSVAQSVDVTINTTGLSAGSYSGTITVTSSTPGVQGSPKTISVTLTVTDQQLGYNHPASGSFAPVDEGTWGSASYQLGAHYQGGSGSDLEIAVYAGKADKVLLEIYNTATGSDALYDYWMVKGGDGVWRAKLNDVPDKTLYAFRAWGPNWGYNASWDRGNSSAGFGADHDSAGNRYNPNKVLYDPYTREMSHDRETPAMAASGENGAMYGTGGLSDATPHGYSGTITGDIEIDRRNVDTGRFAPKSVALVPDSTSYGTKPAIPARDAIIYECHVRGFTQDSSVTNLSSILNGIPGFENVVDVPDEYRGTYKGAGYMAKYLKALGFSTIELVPIHESANDSIDTDPLSAENDNYWGYMTYGYFAPDRRYSYDKSLGGPTREFKEMVKAFHDEGLEVYLDVVYNHTGEGGNWDPKYIPYPTVNPDFTTNCKELTSFAGLDNEGYYTLVDGNKGEYWETTGCGNNLNASRTVVKNLIKDSLIYWMDDMGVDGFRFDLATVLGREGATGFNPGAQLLADIESLGAARDVEMIAEAWDIGEYQVGKFPNGWGEWNGKYRDAVRQYVNNVGSSTNYFTWVFNGSYDDFNDQGGPHRSVNFITAHDGFGMMDLVSYGSKQNWYDRETKTGAPAWPWGPSDGGSDNNTSSDHGGDQALRRKQLRNIWTILMFSRGVPMTVWGDEFARTQNGNNNTYNVDSIATWNNYYMINTDSPTTVLAGDGQHNNYGTDTNPDGKNNLFLFASYVTNLRKDHHGLRSGDYYTTYDFKKEDGASTLADDSRCIWVRIDSSAAGDNDFLLLINGYTAQIDFSIPAPDGGKTWARVIDTGSWAEGDNNSWDPASAWKTTGGQYGVEANTIVVLEEISL
jgi:isoamylase